MGAGTSPRERGRWGTLQVVRFVRVVGVIEAAVAVVRGEACVCPNRRIAAGGVARVGPDGV